MKTKHDYLLLIAFAFCTLLYLVSCESHRSTAPAYGDGGGGRMRAKDGGGGKYRYRSTEVTTGWSYDSSGEGAFSKTSTGKETRPVSTQPKAGAGLLTATEINDFTKWDVWNDFVKAGLAAHQKTWKVNPYTRYTVSVENETGNPLQGAAVLLKNSSGKVLWEAVSDNTGKAQLWPSFMGNETDSIPAKIEISYKGITETISNPVEYGKGINLKKINTACFSSNVVDIAFVVDATGSMSDEIEYLKEEVNDIIGKVKTKNEKLIINTAAVFYRDKSDAYLTRENDFSPDINVTTSFIKKQGAGGGGDFPEAVDAGLDVAVNKLKWNNESRSKMIFIFLDAPPHTEKAKEMQEVIYSAAQKGIKIVPVFSSGSDHSNQFIMRSAALATNGTSVFITNHSGIGGHHEDPVIDKFDVELLNNVLQRVIEENIFMPECSPSQQLLTLQDTVTVSNSGELLSSLLDSIMNKTSSDSVLMATLLPYTLYASVNEMKEHLPLQQMDTVKMLQPVADEIRTLRIYPNPTSGMIKAEFSKGADFIYLADLSGKLLNRFDVRDQQLLQTDLSFYPSGIYFVQYQHREKWISAKVILQK